MADDPDLLAPDSLDEKASRRAHRFRRARRIGGGVAILLGLAGGGLWLARKPIAESFIANMLAARGVQGSYQITRIGPRTQRLDNLVIGDPRYPDLIVRFVEIDIGWGLAGARISQVRAQGVRLRGRLHDGVLDLGQVQKLIDGGTGEARLPDWTVEVGDARADIITDFGPLTFALEGRGAVRSGFGGTLGIAASALQMGDCRLDRLLAPLDLATENERILIKGPVSGRAIACSASDVALTAPKLDLNLSTDLALTDMGGAISLYADGVRQGARKLEQLSGLVTLSGKLDNLRGSASLAATKTAFDGIETRGAKVGGNFALRPGQDRAIAWIGLATIDDIRPTKALDLSRIARSAAGTPVAPLADKLVRAVGNIGKANRLTLGGAVNMLGLRGNATLDRLELTSASGASIKVLKGGAVKFSWPDGVTEAAGTIQLNGGGLPEGRIALTAAPGGELSGTATFAEYREGTARLGLAPMRFSIDRAGRGRVATVLSLDGPLPDGGLTGLVVPVDARIGAGGAVSFVGDCAPVRWTSVRLSSLALDPATVRLCGIADGQMRISSPTLKGRLGDSPISFAARSARYALRDGQFELEQPDVRIGGAESPVKMAAIRLAGGSGAAGFAGTIEDGAGRIGTVPLDLSAIAGRWSFKDGRLDLDGALRVADTQADPRFNPLAGQDVHLTLGNGRIDARGLLVNPKRNVPVATVTIRHELSSGAGQADLALRELSFGNALQPDDLTPLSLGVVANVEGAVSGAGRINWTGTAVTSSGTFSTRDMALAAAFGPVTGLATTIHFADLLGMRTEPGQVATVRSINPGIEVRDGTIRYALLSSTQARIEGGRWPFSGGTLELLPATLELDAHKPRNLSFRVVGLDAGAFINTLQLENISATGTFDGLMPMIFDERGGRIEGGLLVARQQGNAPLILNSTLGLNVPCDQSRQSGNLSYVGEVSNAQLGTFSKLAFDALKNLRYRCLAIMLDGALDGEFVTRISVNGINQGTEEARKSVLARPFLGLPFIFNVRIEAPFRGLLGTAADLADPRALVRRKLDEEKVPVLTDNDRLVVQPRDSDKAIKGEPK